MSTPNSAAGPPPASDHRYEPAPGLDARLEAGVLHLTLDRPEKRNALDDGMVAALIGHLERAGTDEAVRVILVAGVGDHFCGGADIVARNAGPPAATGDPSQTAPAEPPAPAKPRVGSIQRRLPGQAHRLIPLLLSIQTPVVCRVQGYAAGIGFHLALAADFCVAARDARFWEPFVARGFTPDSGGTWLLPRLAGLARAKELLLLGRELSGEEAAAMGLVHRAVTPDRLAAVTADLVDHLAQGPTVAVGLTKWLIHAGSGLDLERHLGNEAFALELSSRSADFREGLAAFREKREPRFEGR